MIVDLTSVRGGFHNFVLLHFFGRCMVCTRLTRPHLRLHLRRDVMDVVELTTALYSSGFSSCNLDMVIKYQRHHLVDLDICE